MEVVDFNNPISNDRAAAHGGDVVSAEAGRKSETLFIDTRRFSHSVQAVALVASQFAGTFGSSRVDDLEITVRHLSFVDSSQPSEASMTSFKSRGVLRAHDLFAARLARTPPRPRTPGAELLEEARAPTYRGRAGILRVAVLCPSRGWLCPSRGRRSNAAKMSRDGRDRRRRPQVPVRGQRQPRGPLRAEPGVV